MRPPDPELVRGAEENMRLTRLHNATRGIRWVHATHGGRLRHIAREEQTRTDYRGSRPVMRCACGNWVLGEYCDEMWGELCYACWARWEKDELARFAEELANDPSLEERARKTRDASLGGELPNARLIVERYLARMGESA